MKLAFLIIVQLFFIGGVWGQDDRGYLVKIGDSLPDFNIELISGERFTSESLIGNVILFQFTASWCSVCRKEMPFIESEIWQPLKSNPDFKLIAIDRDEPIDVVIKYINKTGITYPVALDPNADIFGLFASKDSGVTRNVIINKKGEIVFLTRLFDRDEFDAMKKVVFDLVNEK